MVEKQLFSEAELDEHSARRRRGGMKRPFELGRPEPLPTGCICPPTSERTCQNPKCPRKDHRSPGERIRDGGGVFNG